MLKPMYNTKLYQEIWNTPQEFAEAYKSSYAYGSITDANSLLLGNLLYAKYANNPIANYDENQFKSKIWSVVFRFGRAWEKKLELQDKLKNLTDEELIQGSKQIMNHAYNPSTSPTTSALEEITEINEQNSNSVKRSKVDAYALLYGLIENDVTTEFINRFSECFKQFAIPEYGPIYESED